MTPKLRTRPTPSASALVGADLGDAQPFPAGNDARSRLIAAMAAAISEKGYAETTVADVVRVARTSRRTFYEYFDDRADCFLAVGDAITDYLLARVARAASREVDWRVQVDRALDAYLGAMAANPRLTRSFVLELFGMGARASR
jgi:AcrR family transcriptional regulator